jgi:proline iminopeptidase
MRAMAARQSIIAAAIAALTVFTASPLRAQKANEGYIASADSIRLFYRVVGRGRDTIIAVHGGPGVDLESIFGDFTPLADEHVVIFYDQRGAGRSTLPSDTTVLTAAGQIRDLDAVRRHFKLDRVVLVAHSYGPLLVASYAIAHPEHVRAMVLLGAVPPHRGDFWQRFALTMGARIDSAQRAQSADANRRLVAGINIRQACRDYWAIALRPRVADPDRSLPRIHSDLCASDPAGIRYGLTKTNGLVMASYGDWDLRPSLPALRIPTLIVHGEQDAIPMDMVAEWTMIPTSRLVRVPNAAHMLYAERPEVVWSEVKRFLNDLPRR